MIDKSLWELILYKQWKNKWEANSFKISFPKAKRFYLSSSICNINSVFIGEIPVKQFHLHIPTACWIS